MAHFVKLKITGGHAFVNPELVVTVTSLVADGKVVLGQARIHFLADIMAPLPVEESPVDVVEKFHALNTVPKYLQ